MLVTCFEVPNCGGYCIVRRLEAQLGRERGDEPLTNEFDCPLLTLTSKLYCLSPSRVYSAVSVVHMCNDSCMLKQLTTHRQFEREEVNLDSKLVFVHDLLNNLFCLNIYCIQ